MTVFRKSLIFLFCFFILIVGYGQKEKRPVLIGAGGAFSNEIRNGGISAFGSFHINDYIRLTPGFTYFFPKTEVLIDGEQSLHLWELYIDGQYLFFEPTNQFNIYGLAGLNYSFINDKGFAEDPVDPTQKYHFNKRGFAPGINLGVGFEISFGKQLSGLLDVKYEISSYSQVVVRGGLVFKI